MKFFYLYWLIDWQIYLFLTCCHFVTSEWSLWNSLNFCQALRSPQTIEFENILSQLTSKSGKWHPLTFLLLFLLGHDERGLNRRNPSVHGSVSSIRSTDRFAPSPDQERILIQVSCSFRILYKTYLKLLEPLISPSIQPKSNNIQLLMTWLHT